MMAHFFSRRNYAILFATLLFVLLPSLAAAKTVALFPLHYESDHPKEFVYKGISSMLSNRISGGDVVVSRPELPGLLPEQIAEKISDLRWVIDTARSMDADYAIFGTLNESSSETALELALIDLSMGEPSAKKISKTASSEDQVISMLAETANEVRTLMGSQAKTGGQGVTASGPVKSTTGPPAEQAEGQLQEKGIFTTPHPEKLLLETPEFTMPRRPDVSAFQSGGTISDDASGKSAGTIPLPDMHRPLGMIRIPAAVMSFDVGDLDDDGIYEFIVLDRAKVQIYKETANKRGFAVVDTLPAEFSGTFLKVSTGDANKNGKAEIYTVSRYGSGITSVVWEWDGPGSFRKINEIDGHLRVLKSTASPELFLLNQQSTVRDPFIGPIASLKFDEKNRIVAAGTLNVPRGAQFYTLSILDVDGDGINEIAGLDGRSYLTIWDTHGTILAQSDESFDGTANTIIEGESADIHPQADPIPPVHLNSRTVVTDINGDDKPEILVVRNFPLLRYFNRLNLYSDHEVMAYEPSGSGLNPLWSSGKMSNCLVEIQSVGNVVCLAVQTPAILKWKKDKTEIWWFER